MSAPAARTLAEIVAEGLRLERELAAENARKRPDWHLVSELSSRLFHIYMQHGPALLAVAEAADKREDPLAAAAREALDVLTRLADSAYQWAGRDVPPGLVPEIDAAKARLAGVLRG